MKVMHTEMEAGRMKNFWLNAWIEVEIMNIMHAKMEAGRIKEPLLKFLKGSRNDKIMSETVHHYRFPIELILYFATSWPRRIVRD